MDRKVDSRWWSEYYRNYEVIDWGLHEPLVLVEHTIELSSSFFDISIDPSKQSNVWICFNVYLHIQQLSNLLLSE